MKIKLLLLLVVISVTSLSAQNYETALGVRGELFSGISYKQFVSETKAYEFLMGFDRGGMIITGLAAYHKPIGTGQIQWFYGGGMHMGFWDASVFNPWTSSTSIAGFDGLIGIEYSFIELPFCVSVDYKPILNLVGDFNVHPDIGGLTVRYTF